MKSVSLVGQGKVVLQEVPVPSLERGDLLVEMHACGLCGSDLEKIHGEYTAAPPVLGHEAVGVIRETEGDVGDLATGDRVFPHHHVPCYACHYCRAGSETMCPHYRRWYLDPSGFAEFFRVPAWNVAHGGVLPLPDAVSDAEGSLIEPLACSIRALDRFDLREGSDVLVAGAGPMGLLILKLLPHYGIHRTFVSEVSGPRRAYAAREGVTVLNPREEDVVVAVREATEGRGADVAVVATGNPKALLQALDAVRDGGTLGLVGIPEAQASFPRASRLVTREVRVVSSNAATERDTKRALEMIQEGAVEVASLVSHRVALEDFPQAVALAERAESLKVVVVP